MSVRIWSYSGFPFIQRAPKKRLCQQERPTSTWRSTRTITIVLSSTSALHLNQAMLRTYRLSWILSQAVRTRAVQPRKDCMPSGRETKLQITLILFDWFFFTRICVPASDAINGSIGEGIEDILNIRSGKRVQVQGLFIN